MRGPADNILGREMHQDQINHQRVIAQLLQIYDRAPCRSCGTSRLDCSRIRERGGDDAIVGCCFPTCDHSIAPSRIRDLIQQVESGQVREPEPETKCKRSSPYWYLNQGVYWLNRDGDQAPIAGMDPTYRYNCLKLLERRARGLGEVYSWGFHLSGSGPLGPSGDAACDAFEQAGDELNRHIERDPVAWIRTTPLWQALNRGLPGNPYKRWRLGQRARHWSQCYRREHNSGPCTCKPTRSTS